MKHILTLAVLIVSMSYVSAYTPSWLRTAHQEANKSFQNTRVVNTDDDDYVVDVTPVYQLDDTARGLIGDIITDRGLTQEQVAGLCSTMHIQEDSFSELAIPAAATPSDLKAIMPTVAIIPTNSQLNDGFDGPWSCGYRSLFNAMMLQRSNDADLIGKKAERMYQNWFKGNRRWEGSHDFVLNYHRAQKSPEWFWEDGSMVVNKFIADDDMKRLMQRQAVKKGWKKHIDKICFVTEHDITNANSGTYLETFERIRQYRESNSDNTTLVMIVLEGLHYKVFYFQKVLVDGVLAEEMFEANSLTDPDGQASACAPLVWGLVTQTPLMSKEEFDLLEDIRRHISDHAQKIN